MLHRIMLGNNLLFVLHHPLDLTKQQKNKKVTDEPTFDTAQQEIAQKSGIAALAGGGAGKPKGENVHYYQCNEKKCLIFGVRPICYVH